MNVLVATDLDRTLIYSRAALGLSAGVDPALVCVEVYQGAEASFMTAQAAENLAAVAKLATVVPVTTRTAAQLARVTLPGPAAGYAVAANGGLIFTDGLEDRWWSRQVAKRVAESAPLGQVWTHLSQTCSSDWALRLREAEGLFCYAVVDRSKMPAGLLIEIADWADSVGWTASLQGRKLYWVPQLLTKSAALAEVALRVGSEVMLAAGDSLLDTDLLLAATEAIMPRHGELFDAGWSSPRTRLTESSGVLAGQEIVTWLLSRVRDAKSR